MAAIQQGDIDAVAGGFDNLIDDIVPHKSQQGLLAMLDEVWENTRYESVDSFTDLTYTCVAANIKLKVYSLKAPPSQISLYVT